MLNSYYYFHLCQQKRLIENSIKWNYDIKIIYDEKTKSRNATNNGTFNLI